MKKENLSVLLFLLATVSLLIGNLAFSKGMDYHPSVCVEINEVLDEMSDLTENEKEELVRRCYNNLSK